MPKALQETYEILLLDTLEDIPYPSSEAIQVVIDITAQENPDAAQVKTEEIVDTQHTERAGRSRVLYPA